MNKNGALLGMLAETPLHPGTGTATGVVDLPVQREVHTNYPIIVGSSLKGAMREKAARGADDDIVNTIFGPANDGAPTHAGAISISDARLLAFPVRALEAVCVWVTCPKIVDRLRRDMGLLNLTPNLPKLEDIGKDKAYVASDFPADKRLVLEEIYLGLDKNKTADIATLANIISGFIPSGDTHSHLTDILKKHLVVISDADFSHLVQTCTQVSARIVLDDKKSSKNLWYEESIPPDTIFYTMIMADKPRNGNKTIIDAADVLKQFKDYVCGYLQVGGNETVGMGWCALAYYTGPRT
jgi:CRISPR-associated protein Cmr4